MVELTLTRGRALALALVLLAVLVVAGRRLTAADAASSSASAARLTTVSAEPARLPRMVVHVVGAVRRPGLYRLRDGSRVADAVARAGGATRRAELAGVNLAAPAVDGSQIVVPRRAEPAPVAGSPTGGAAAPPSLPQKVSLASATLEQLDALPGVGPVTARKILDYRQAHAIRSVDDLDAVPGIGPARLVQLRELVTP